MSDITICYKCALTSGLSCDIAARACAQYSTEHKMALPQPAEDLCFSSGALIEKDFNVDEFVSAIRKRVTIECLREDLDSYFRTLKNAMVELINKDYADFVALSANLVSTTSRKIAIVRCMNSAVIF